MLNKENAYAGYKDDQLCRLINYACGSSVSSGTGSTNPSSSDSFGGSPSSIPTGETPFGVELLYGNGEFSYGFFEGFGYIGIAGGSITKENLFFSNVNNIRAQGITLSDKDLGDDINEDNFYLGGAIGLFKETFKGAIIPTIGLGIRRYKETGHWRESIGLSLASDYVHTGINFARTNNKTGVLQYNFGFRVTRFFTDFTYIQNLKGIENKTWIFSMAYTFFKFLGMFVGYRYQDNVYSDGELAEIASLGGKVKSTHIFGGVQIQVFKYVSIGYLHNFVLDADGHISLRIFIGPF